jgi:hypothetical protein
VNKIFISYHWSWFGLQMQIMLLVGSLGSRYVLHFLKLKNYKIAKNSTTAKAREKDKCRFGILQILVFFDACLTKLKKPSNFTK